MATQDRQLHHDCPPSLTTYGQWALCGQVLPTFTYFLPLSFSTLLSSYAGLLLLSRWHTFLPDGPLSVAYLMPLLHPFLLAAPPPSGCNLNLTSKKRSCQITLPKVPPFHYSLPQPPYLTSIVPFPVFNDFICLFTSVLPTLIHVYVLDRVMSDSL